MDVEWYEDPAWDAEAEAAFRRRLSRARGQKDYYLRRKAAAIADAHPDAALALCDERRAAGDPDEAAAALYAKATILARAGRRDEMFAALGAAIGEDGMALGAPAAGEFCCLAAYFRRDDLVPRAVKILDALDAAAEAQLGRPFRSYPVRAARALIAHRSGRSEAARLAAREALELALAQSSGLLAGATGPAPDFPSPLNDILLVIADLWDTARLGPPPEI